MNEQNEIPDIDYTNKNVRYLRNGLGLSSDELATILKIGPSSYNSLETENGQWNLLKTELSGGKEYNRTEYLEYLDKYLDKYADEDDQDDDQASRQEVKAETLMLMHTSLRLQDREKECLGL